MVYGTTYSHRKAQQLQLDPIAAFEEILDLQFDIIRLGCYWDEIEKVQGTYDFSIIKQYLDLCEKKGQKVVITVGMKAPQWPEFYFPVWLQTRLMDEIAPLVYTFTEASVSELKSYSCITHWQVENEPLDPSGPEQLSIPEQQLYKQTMLVRKLDPNRKIIINLWGNDVLSRNFIPKIKDMADIVGLDIYYKQFLLKKFALSLYRGPEYTERVLLSKARNWRTPVWITELQAEPWEADSEEYKAMNPKSMNPNQLQKNVSRAKLLQPEAIVLWGSEYWLWKKKQGDKRMWETVQSLINEKFNTV